MALNFDSGPYLELFRLRQAQEQANRPDITKDVTQPLLQGLQLMQQNKQQNALLDLQKQELGEKKRINDYEYGTPIDPNAYTPEPYNPAGGSGIGKSIFMPGGQAQVAQGSSLIDRFNSWRAGGMKGQMEPDFVPALGAKGREEYQKAQDFGLKQNETESQNRLRDAQSDYYRNRQTATPGSTGSFMIGGITGEGNPVFYNTKNPTNTIVGEVPGGGILYPRTPSQDQSNAAIYGQRASESAQQLDNLINSGFDPASIETGVIEFAPNILQNPNVQSYQQIKRNFINATLRRESGATIRPEEMQEANKQYFPQAGDSPEVRKLKAQNRATVISSLNRIAGPMAAPGNQGLPQVGDSFQGGRVKSIRRID